MEEKELQPTEATEETLSDTLPEEPAAQSAEPDEGGEASKEETVCDEAPVSVEKKEDRAFSAVRTVFEYVETFCIALSVMIVLFLFFFRNVTVDGDSMLPTLHGGDSSDHADTLIISDFMYEPKTGDIVVLNIMNDGQPLIKRVIASEGQRVRIDFTHWEVEVDGVLLDETYIRRQAGATMYMADMDRMYGVDENGVCEFTVEEGKVFVMGDNRNNSKDSRYLEVGQQDVDHILGKVILRVFPLQEFGTVD